MGQKLILQWGPYRGSVIDTDTIPGWAKPARIYENPYWIFSGALTRAEVQAYLDKMIHGGPDLDPEVVRKVAGYCVDFAKHIVVAGLLCGAHEGYDKEMRPVIEKVDRMAAQATTSQDISDIINELMRVALDPL